MHNSGVLRGEKAEAHLAVIASVAKQSILSSRPHGIFVASLLAMTAYLSAWRRTHAPIRLKPLIFPAACRY